MQNLIYYLLIDLLTNRTNLVSDVVQNRYKINNYIQENYKIGQIKCQKLKYKKEQT